MPHTLLIRLDGPLQSWGVTSRYARRDSLDHPSKSGVVGICAAALGRPRDASIADLAALRFGVLVVDPGRSLDDYHTVSNVVRANRAQRVDVSPPHLVGRRTAHQVARAGALPSSADTSGGLKSTELTHRRYIADAAFVAGLAGDEHLLGQVLAALMAPRFMGGLGRASCLPAAPLWFGERDDRGLVPGTLEEAFAAFGADADTWLERRQAGERERALRASARRVIVECSPEEATLRTADQPTENAFSTRRFGTRYSRSYPLEVTADA